MIDILRKIARLANEVGPQEGRMMLGSAVVRDASVSDLGSRVYQGCIKSSPCPPPTGQAKTGVLLLVVTNDMANNPQVSNRLESSFSYVGGRADTLFSGVYVKERLPGLIAVSMLGGLQ